MTASRRCFECGSAAPLIQGMCELCRALYYADEEFVDHNERGEDDA